MAASRRANAQLGIDPTLHAPHNNFEQIAPYEEAPLPTDEIDLAYGVGVMQQIPCGGKTLATPYLDEILETPDAEYVVILATLKCVAHGDAVDGSEQEAAACVLDCSTVVAMDPAGRILLLETMGARASSDNWARRHFKIRKHEPQEGLVSPKEALVAYLATLIGEEHLIVGCRLGFDLASLGWE